VGRTSTPTTSGLLSCSPPRLGGHRERQLYEEVRDRAQRLEAIRGITTAIIAGEGSVTGEVIRTGKAVVLADASADERVVQPIVRAQVGPTMFVPLAVRGTILGTLTVANAKGGRLLREAAIPLVETFAEQAAVAIEYGRLQGELQRLALLEDRERIAKELHDGAIQALFAVGMGLQGSAALAASEELRGRLQDAVEEWTGSCATCAPTSSACARPS
jgi:GAF domain-containing protein